MSGGDDHFVRGRVSALPPNRGVTILVLGILGLVLCGLLAIPAWSMGNQDLRAIDGGTLNPSNRGMVQAGRILGIVGSCILMLQLVVFAIAATVGALDSY